ncbi:MAG: hypothetical protein AAB483_04210 [Patescibacteria group bacterium]
MKGEQKTCQNCKTSFTIDPEDFEFYKKITVPPPTFCWKCRFQRRCAFRNERHLYRGKSALSGKDLLTIYPPDSNVTIYEEKEWWGDGWDAMDYGRDYDVSRNFFEQFMELVRQVPRDARNVVHDINSEYSGNAGRCKNCYLIFNANDDEDCAYGNGVDMSKDCYDNSHIIKCERCYNSLWLERCYQTHFSVQCTDCTNVWFSKNCRGSTNCFGCVNLRNKSYCIWNVQYTKEEYEEKLAEMKLYSWKEFSKIGTQAAQFWKKFPTKYLEGTKNVNVSGQYIHNSKNIKQGYIVVEGEHLAYCQYIQFLPSTKDCYDLTVWGESNALSYENMECGQGTFNVHFCLGCYMEVKNLEYCQYCHSSSDLFGCVGVRKKQYCIFNKQYSKEDYESLRAKIIKHMHDMPYTDARGRVYRYGEFFPIELSTVHYNRTLAIEHFPITKEEATRNNYRWYDPPPPEYAPSIQAHELSDSIREVKDPILKEIISCEKCGRGYRIIPSELVFLRKEEIPLPRMCVNCRHETRIAKRQKAFTYHRNCAKCGKTIETSYSPDSPEIVYCDGCFNAEVA